jgi:hypothetical protein
MNVSSDGLPIFSSIWALALSGAIYLIDDSLSYGTVQGLIYHD